MIEVSKWNAPRGTTLSEAADGEYVLTPDYDALRAENERLHLLCEDRFNEIAQLHAELAALKAVPDGYVVPCDVMLPPATRIKRGCSLNTLLVAMAQREEFPAAQRVFNSANTPAPAPLTRDELTALRQPVADEREAFEAWATRLYNTGYHAGHHDTVEGRYTHVYRQDMDSYHEEVVAEWLTDNPQQEQPQ